MIINDPKNSTCLSFPVFHILLIFFTLHLILYVLTTIFLNHWFCFHFLWHKETLFSIKPSTLGIQSCQTRVNQGLKEWPYKASGLPKFGAWNLVDPPQKSCKKISSNGKSDFRPNWLVLTKAPHPFICICTCSQVSHNICQTAFLDFGDKGPKSPRLCHLPSNHLQTETTEHNTTKQCFLQCFLILILFSLSGALNTCKVLQTSCLPSVQGGSRPRGAWPTSCLAWCVRSCGRPLWMAAMLPDAAKRGNM